MNIRGRTKCVVPNSGMTSATAPFIAQTPVWWIKSPIALSAYMIFMCLSVNMKMKEKFETFISRIIKDARKREAGYLRQALFNGTLESFLDKSLPDLNKRGKSAWKGYKYAQGFANHAPSHKFRIERAIDRIKILSK